MLATAHFAVLTKGGEVTFRAHLTGRLDTLLAPDALLDTLRAQGAIELR